MADIEPQDCPETPVVPELPKVEFVRPSRSVEPRRSVKDCSVKVMTNPCNCNK